MSEHRAVSNDWVEQQWDESLIPVWKSFDVPDRRASDVALEDFDGSRFLDVTRGSRW